MGAVKAKAATLRRSSKAILKDSELFRDALLHWYDANRRDLPWRRTSDPYAIWLSEIMLQQTRVTAVLEHYRIFLERFPNVTVLASSAEDDVLAAWSGLGYYRRARMLHQSAREIVERYAGQFPRTAEALRALPGIGRYTAAAIASIAFQETVAVVDGNVERVLRRIAGKNLTLQESWKLAQDLVSQSRPGDFNQAMMELGATVCVPREPHCLTCPLRSQCATRGELPGTKVAKRQKQEKIWFALERRNGHVRLVRRPRKASLMAGMWELPRLLETHALTCGAHWRTFHHSITVTDFTVHVIRVEKNGAKPAARGKWIAVGEIPSLPITGLTRKVLKADGII